MPLGSRPIPLHVDAPAGPAPASLPSGVTGDAPLVDQLGLTSPDLWSHVTVQLAAGVVARVGVDTEIEVLEVLELEGVGVLIGLESRPTAEVYDIRHPGAGELVKTIPPTRNLYLLADPDSPAPTRPVELHLYGGRYAARLAG